MVRAKQKKKSLVVKKKGEKSLLGIGLLHDLLWWGKTRLYCINSHKIPCAMQRFRVGNPPIWHGIWKGIRRGNYLDSYSGKPLIKGILKKKKKETTFFSVYSPPQTVWKQTTIHTQTHIYGHFRTGVSNPWPTGHLQPAHANSWPCSISKFNVRTGREFFTQDLFFLSW